MSRRDAGLTLLELMVAFFIFISLLLMLVGISAQVLDGWTRGETRKETSDRADVIFSILEDDLRNLFAERETPWTGPEDRRRYLLGAHLIADIDRAGRRKLFFVRSADRDEGNLAAPPLASRFPQTDMFAELFEVAYMFADGPGETTLLRGMQYFDRQQRRKTFFPPAKVNPGSLRPVDSGVVFLGFQFWGQHTIRWEPERGKRVKTGETASEIWDSSRTVLRNFQYHQRRTNPTNPDFVYPELIRVTLILKPTRERKVVLASAISEAAKSVRISNTKDLPDGPALVRIDGEIMEYESKDTGVLKISKRGARGTSKAKHDAGSEVMYGDVHTRVITLPVRMDAVSK